MTMLKRHWRDPLFRALAGACIALVSALAVFHVVFFSDVMKRSSDLERRLHHLEMEYAYQHGIAQQVESIKNASPALNATVEKLNRNFSTVAFSGDLDRFVAASGVDLLAQSYDDPKKLKEFSFVQIKVRVKASYQSVRKFLQAVNNGRFYVVLTKAKFEKNDRDVMADLDFQVRYLEESDESKEI